MSIILFRKSVSTFRDHALASRWRNKIRRRFYSPYNKVVHRGRYFICSYFGARFSVRSANVGGLEISAQIAEHAELNLVFTKD